MTHTQTLFLEIARLVEKRIGLLLPPEKHYLLQDRLLPLARSQGFGGVERYLASVLLHKSESALEAIMSALLTHESSFFRDPELFDEFSQMFLPEFSSSLEVKGVLRVWSAACATGQEPYSLLMKWDEEMHRLGKKWTLHLLATDYSNTALTQASEGIYSSFDIQRGLPEHLCKKHLIKVGDGRWQIRKDMRTRIHFAQHNLLHALPSAFGKFDVIFCRNALIYFSDNVKYAVLHHLRQALNPKGILVAGSAEDITHWDNQFKRLKNSTFAHSVKP